ncbi:MAG: ABC transporter related protein, partial [uncultured bacterium]
LEKSLQDYFLHEFHLGDQKTTSILVTAGFPVAIQRTKLALLSHGQRARAAFLALHLTQPNFYVMDEPTNHLDIVGQEQLESEILKQEAASIVVSHDRVFTQNIGTRFYVIDNKKLSQIDLPTVYYKRLI